MFKNNSQNNQRIYSTERRKSILEGNWIYYLQQHVSEKLQIERVENMGLPSKSINLFRSVVEQLSVLYNKEPIILNDQLSEVQASYLDSFNLFDLHPKLNKYVIGLRECFLKLEWSEGDHISSEGIRLRIVTPDLIEAYADMDNPTVPFRIEEKRERIIGGKCIECLDVWDIRDPLNPYFAVVSLDGKTNYTEILGLTFEYPYINTEGFPFLPWVLYHASEATCLFSPFELEDLVEGTLDVGLDWSFWRHCLLQSSWTQKYTVDLDLKGLEHKDSGEKSNRSEIPVAPNSLLQFQSIGEKAGVINVLESATDPKAMAEAISIHSLSICESLGYGADIQQTKSGSSGVAITLRKDSIREAQKKYTKQFKKGDIEMLNKASLINNLYSDLKLPIDGYNVNYPSIPMSYDELTTRLDYSLKLLANGLTTKERIIKELNPDFDQKMIDDILGVVEVSTTTQGE